MNKIIVVTVAIVVAGAVGYFVLAGGNGELSKPEYIAKVDAICAQAQEQLKPVGERITKAMQNLDGSPATAKKSFGVARRELTKAQGKADAVLAEIQAFPQPREDRRTIDRWFVEMNNLSKLARKAFQPYLAALAEGERRGANQAVMTEIEAAGTELNSSPTIVKAKKRADALTAKYGFKHCGKPN